MSSYLTTITNGLVALAAHIGQVIEAFLTIVYHGTPFASQFLIYQFVADGTRSHLGLPVLVFVIESYATRWFKAVFEHYQETTFLQGFHYIILT